MSPHQRGDHIFPLLPPAALIAGREITLLVRPADKRYFVSRLAGGIVVVLVALAFYNHTVRVHERRVRQTTAIRKFAKKVEKELGQDFPFVHVDARFALRLIQRKLRHA